MKSAPIILLALVFFSCSKVNDVSIQSAPESVFKGDSLQLIAKVNGEGNPDTTLNWVIIDSVSKGTTIDKFGKLIIDREEKATSIAIKAISVQDSSKFSSASIKILLDKSYFLGNWNRNDDEERIWTLTEDSWVEQALGGKASYSFKDLKWKEIKNEDIATKDEFPDGYLVTGVVNEVTNFGFQKGALYRYNLLINKDYSIIFRVNTREQRWGTPDEFIYTRSKK